MNSARQLFQAARDIIDLVRACQSRGMLVETPILGFGLYTMAFVGIYAINFPQMDTEGYLSGGDGDSPGGNSTSGQQATRKALETIGQMRSRLPMASNWFRTIHRVHRYYGKIIMDFKRNAHVLGQGSAADDVKFRNIMRHLTLREGGVGGGLREYKLLEKTLKEFGTIEDEDVETVEGGRDHQSHRMSMHNSKLDNLPPSTQRRSLDHWTAINDTANIEPGSDPSTLRGDTTLSDCSRLTVQPSQAQYPYPQRFPPSTSMPNHSPVWSRCQPTAQAHPPPPISPSSHTASMSSIHSPSPHQHPPNSFPLQSFQSPDPPPFNRISKPYASLPIHSTSTPTRTTPTSSSLPLGPPQSDNATSEVWSKSLRTRLGGEDVAAFLDGRDWEEWFHAKDGEGGSRGGGRGTEGWLSEVWGVGHGGGGGRCM